MAPRGKGNGRARELVGPGLGSSRLLSSATADLEGSTPTEDGRSMRTESVGSNGSNSTHPSGSAANVGGSIPTSDTAMTSHVADTASTNIGGLTRVYILRGELRPSHSASGSITSAFKRSMHPMAFAWSMVPEPKMLEYFEEFWRNVNLCPVPLKNARLI